MVSPPPPPGAAAAADCRQCQVMRAYDLPPGTPLSAVDTRYYASDNTYELDRTYYVNDSECTPINSDIYYKLNLHGVVKYHGQSDPGINGCKVPTPLPPPRTHSSFPTTAITPCIT